MSWSEDQYSESLLQVPTGHHYLVLYSQIEKMRKVYSRYIKSQIQTQPESVILFLPYYDSTEKVREVLQEKGIDIKELEKNGSVVIVDIVKVISNESFGVPETERLRALTKYLENQYKDKYIFVIGDMSVFHHLKKSKELLEYEKNLHKDLKIERWKELCFYHEEDFDNMFTEDQIQEMLDYHKDRVIRI
jgi:hypothetical protein